MVLHYLSVSNFRSFLSFCLLTYYLFLYILTSELWLLPHQLLLWLNQNAII